MRTSSNPSSPPRPPPATTFLPSSSKPNRAKPRRSKSPSSTIRKDLQEAEAPAPPEPGGEGRQACGGGGEAVSGGWGVCDDHPVEAGGAAARLPDPIPAQARHYRSHLMGLAVLSPNSILVHDAILQALLVISRHHLRRHSSSCRPVYFETEKAG